MNIAQEETPEQIEKRLRKEFTEEENSEFDLIFHVLDFAGKTIEPLKERNLPLSSVNSVMPVLLLGKSGSGAFKPSAVDKDSFVNRRAQLKVVKTLADEEGFDVVIYAQAFECRQSVIESKACEEEFKRLGASNEAIDELKETECLAFYIKNKHIHATFALVEIDDGEYRTGDFLGDRSGLIKNMKEFVDSVFTHKTKEIRNPLNILFERKLKELGSEKKALYSMLSFLSKVDITKALISNTQREAFNKEIGEKIINKVKEKVKN